MENFMVNEEIDVSKINYDNEELIEYEISECVSLLYNKLTHKFFIYVLDYNEFEEYIIDIEDDFKDLQFDDVNVSKQDYEEFKELVLKSA